MRRVFRPTILLATILTTGVLYGAEAAPGETNDPTDPADIDAAASLAAATSAADTITAAEAAAAADPKDDLGPDPAALDGRPATPLQRQVARRVTALVSPPDSKPTKPEESVPTSLDHGIIGVLGSPAAGYTLVLTKGTDGKALISTIVKGLPAEAAAGLSFRVSERTSDELREAWVAVFAGDWQSSVDVTGRSMAVDLSPEREAVEVVLGGEAPPLGRADTMRQPLEDVPAGAVVVEYGGESGRASRVNDSAPHWGAAKITSGGTACTSGFTVRGKTTGTLYSLTAGHCGANGSNWNSGTYYYGEMVGKSNYPDYDQARLGGSTNAPTIYTDGLDNFSTRKVTGANNGEVGDSICASGTVTRSICGIKIKALNATFCDNPAVESTCTYYLLRGRRDDDRVIARRGDSGGPVYQRNSTQARASVRGIIVAFDMSGVRLFAERYTSISNHLNVTAVTTN